MEEDLAGDQQDDEDVYEGGEEEEEDEAEPDLYQQIFNSYQKISAQLQYEDGMEEVLQEYNKLFVAAKGWRSDGEELKDGLKRLQEESDLLQQKYTECKEFALGQEAELRQLKQDLELSKRLADTAHLREQSCMDVVSGLRAELARVSKEGGYKELAGAGAGDDEEALAQSKHAQEKEQREQERAAAELELVRERLERALAHSRDADRTAAERDKQLQALLQQLEAQETETNKEMRLKERAESDLGAAREELEQKAQEHALLREQFDAAAHDHRALLDNFKEAKSMSEKLLRENDMISARFNKMQKEMATFQTTLMNLRIDNEQRKTVMKGLEREARAQRKEAEAATHQREVATHKAEMALNAKAEAQLEVERLRGTVVRSLEQEVKEAQDALHGDVRTIERLNRDKEIITKTLRRCQEVGAEQVQALRMQEQARKAIADELDLHTIAARQQQKKITGLELERDRLLLQNTDLELRVEETMDESRLKQMEIHEANKRIVEGEARNRQQQNLYEAVRADRNNFAKHLLEAQDEIAELKQKLKVQGHHVEQMKEDISTKEVDLRRALKTVDKTEKEKEALRVEVQATRGDLSQARADVAAAAKEERRLLTVIQQAESEQRQLVLEMEQMANERDILGSQLVRRNDELALLYEKIHLLEVAMQRGEAHYNQRLEDIRLLKIEVRRLRNEKTLLQRSIDNMARLRQEVFHLERDLTRERHKTRALEEELQNPLNVHRWRKLKGTDPATFDLVEKVQLLQKRLLAQAAAAIEREAQLQQAQRLYAQMRQLLERQPGPEVGVALQRARQALRERGRKMKVLVAEATMYEAQVTEFKSALERAQGEATELKRKHLEQKLRERRHRAKPPSAGDAPSAPLATPSGPPSARRFMGGGFNMASKTRS